MVNGETPLAVFCGLELIYVPRKGKKSYGKTGLGVVIVSMGNLLTEEDIQAMYEDVKRFPKLHL